MDEPQIVPLSGNASRQYIDACTAFEARQKARKEAASVQGTMYWHKQNGVEYLPQWREAGAATSS